jgi:flagellar M-ring protein FliF
MADESNIASQIQQTLKDMSTTQKGMVAAITLTVLLVLVGFGLWASQETMGTLFSNLPAQDANRIVEELKKGNIKYELSQDQRSISVPENRVGELRLKFAGDGLPKGEGIGFEKLESPSLTTTDFTQKIMYRRAMESELAKTIMSIQQVAQATVHISPTNDSPFVTEKEDAKASVLLKLKGSKMLPEDNTQAIVNLLAASVEGLKPEHVVVIDQFSRILSRNDSDPVSGVSDSQKKVQREEEEHLVQQVTDLLEPVVGIGKVRATAHVELDFDKVKTNEETYNPQGQVERETKVVKEHELKRDAAGGVPGTASNLAPAAGAATAAGAPTAAGSDLKDKEETDTHYEISKQLRSVEQAPGTVKRMSVAVIVDHASQWDKDGKGDPVEKLVPRSPEELKKIHDQVSSAVGYQAKRGDDLTVENIAFAPLGNPKEEKEERQQKWVNLAEMLAPKVGYFILGLIIFFMVVLPLLKRLGSALNRPAPLRVHVGEDGSVEGGEHGTRKFTPTRSVNEIQAEIEAELNAEGASGAPEAQRRGLIKKRIQESTLADAETVASLVRSWIIEDGR